MWYHSGFLILVILLKWIGLKNYTVFCVLLLIIELAELRKTKERNEKLEEELCLLGETKRLQAERLRFLEVIKIIAFNSLSYCWIMNVIF